MIAEIARLGRIHAIRVLCHRLQAPGCGESSDNILLAEARGKYSERTIDLTIR